MKKILLSIAVFTAFNSFGQQLDTLTKINVNLTLRATDWAFIAGSTAPTDSVSMYHFRRMRDTIRLANPATWNTNVRINELPADIVFSLYRFVKGQPETMYEQIGNNINNQIKAIPNTILQSFITAFDAVTVDPYINIRNRGKHVVMDN